MIVVNTSFRAAPWADVLYAMDRAWWTQYGAEAAVRFQGEKVAPINAMRGVTRSRVAPYRNSGAQAIAYAVQRGAQRIVLLGYDCQYGPNGERHWHGNHPKGLGNAGTVQAWHQHFSDIARAHAAIKIINCSRSTALECFPRAALEEVLC